MHPIVAAAPPPSRRDGAWVTVEDQGTAARAGTRWRVIRRIRTLLRRDDEAAGSVLRFADLTVDVGTREARRGRREIELTPTEFALLELFLRNPRHVLTRSDIFTRVWGFDLDATSNSLNVYIGILRRKLEASGEPRLLHTVRGVGYVLREPRP